MIKINSPLFLPLLWFARTFLALAFASLTISGNIVGFKHFGFSSSSGSNAYSNLGISEDPRRKVIESSTLFSPLKIDKLK